MPRLGVARCGGGGGPGGGGGHHRRHASPTQHHGVARCARVWWSGRWNDRDAHLGGCVCDGKKEKPHNNGGLFLLAEEAAKSEREQQGRKVLAASSLTAGSARYPKPSAPRSLRAPPRHPGRAGDRRRRRALETRATSGRACARSRCGLVPGVSLYFVRQLSASCYYESRGSTPSSQ